MNKNKKAGFSLVELLIALVILGVVTSGAVQLLGTGSTLMSRQASSSVRLNTERHTLDSIYNELRKGSIASLDVLTTNDPPALDEETSRDKYIYRQTDGRAFLREWDEDTEAHKDTALIGAEGIARLRFSIRSDTNPKFVDNYMLSIDVVANEVNQGEVSRTAHRKVGLFPRTAKTGSADLSGIFSGDAIRFVAFMPANGGGEEPEPYVPPVPPAEGVYHVVQGGTVSSDGTEWDAGDGDLQRAIKAVTTKGGKDAGKQIWVKRGTYTLTGNLNLASGARLYGGLSGDEVSDGQRDTRSLLEKDLTVLDLDEKWGINGDGNLGVGVRIDGFVIQKGKAVKGQGVIHLCHDGHKATDKCEPTTIVNCIFKENTKSSVIAICCYTDLKVENCLFRNNDASGVDRGTIQNDKTNAVSMDVTNSTFLNNKATNGGGIYFTGTGSAIIKSCDFTGNTATTSGGGIYNGGKATITKNIFTSNGATTSGGGLYNSGASTTITSCDFSGNTSASGGGIYSTTASTIKDCIFTKNIVTASGGGMWSGGTPTITNNIFTSNEATTSGGGLHNTGASTITNCDFTENKVTVTTSTTATNGGGGIWNSGAGTIENCSFDINTAEATGTGSVSGGGIYSSGNATIRSCSFTENSAKITTNTSEATKGGGGLWNSGTGEIKNNNFFQNRVSATGAGTIYGGGMYNAGAGSITDCIFTENVATTTGTGAVNGGGIYNNNAKSTITGCVFSENSATTNGGGINAAGDDAPTKIATSIFSGNRATSGGGLYRDGKNAMTVESCNFTANETTTSGGGIYNNTGAATITSCAFTQNSVTVVAGTATTNGGGGLWNGGTGTITSNNFYKNTAKATAAAEVVNGGGMYNAGGGTITGCTFTENTATTTGTGSINGGGMYNTAAPTVSNCTFTGNAAKTNGGGIHNLSGNSVIQTSVFAANTAANGGGMSVVAGAPTVTNCTFSGNTATTNGGGVDVSGTANTATIAVANCTFSANSAPNGAAMYHASNNATVTAVANSIFWENIGTEQIRSAVATNSRIAVGNCVIENGVSASGLSVAATFTQWPANTVYNAPPLIVGVDRNGNSANGADVYIYKLGSGSSALNKGRRTGTYNNLGKNVTIPTVDQRGEPRPTTANDTVVDIGSFEHQTTDVYP